MTTSRLTYIFLLALLALGLTACPTYRGGGGGGDDDDNSEDDDDASDDDDAEWTDAEFGSYVVSYWDGYERICDVTYVFSTNIPEAGNPIEPWEDALVNLAVRNTIDSESSCFSEGLISYSDWVAGSGEDEDITIAVMQDERVFVSTGDDWEFFGDAVEYEAHYYLWAASLVDSSDGIDIWLDLEYSF